MHKVVIGIGGSSGSIYAKVLLDKLAIMPAGVLEAVGVVMSENAKLNWQLELGQDFDAAPYPIQLYAKHDFMAPFASGSAKYNTMIVCPCSMGLLGRMAAGVSDDLVTRAADVILKERRKLIVVPRETPYNRIHLENMLRLHDAGAIICPATPSFYHNPQTLEAMAATVVDRVLDLAGLPVVTQRWSE